MPMPDYSNPNDIDILSARILQDMSKAHGKLEWLRKKGLAYSRPGRNLRKEANEALQLATLIAQELRQIAQELEQPEHKDTP